MTNPKRVGDDVLIGDIRLNWWVWYACLCWEDGQVDAFYHAIDSAFTYLQKRQAEAT